MERVNVGNKAFGKKIDITDPCYDHDTWCRINDLEIEAGLYRCYVIIADDSETNGWGERVAEIGIELVGTTPYKYERIGSIGVDAGMAGFFENKPDYKDEEWHMFCDCLDYKHNKYWLWHVGFFSDSGYGDGSYEVKVSRNSHGKVIAVKIVFITDEELVTDDDDEEDEDY